ncbi:MAG: 4Fe-4S dicluster domain-containing protein [Nitrospirae bacterium]|nr:4Fe-4S dicluster domain-containing protein [Nitrospirota bacterium]
MKKDLILNKNYLSYWLRRLKKEMQLIGPMKGLKGDFVFKAVEQIHGIALNCPSSIPLPKEFIFPQFEEMFEYNPPTSPFNKGGQRGKRGFEKVFPGDKVKDLRNNEKRIIFGVRPCHMAAVNLIDRFYTGRTEPSYDHSHPERKFEDSYYMSRRKNTVFISIGCNNPDPSCFCNSLGTGPFLEQGFDVQLSDLGDRYFVQTGSPAGEKIVGENRHLFESAGKQDYDDQYETVLSALTKFEKRINLEETRRKMLAGKVSDSFWEQVASRCFECGGCVYECPVCTCFNVVDRPETDNPLLPPFSKGGMGGFDKGKRIRMWDTCFFKGFTRMAGGNIPAEKKVMRTKRWWFHKLIYYPEQFKKFGCVGCGRCTITCPGRIDMATVSQKIKMEIK